MYYIKFSSGQEVRVMMMSIARHTHNLPKADWQIKIIEEKEHRKHGRVAKPVEYINYR
jgi:hypothetical protein